MNYFKKKNRLIHRGKTFSKRKKFAYEHDIQQMPIKIKKQIKDKGENNSILSRNHLDSYFDIDSNS